LPPMYAAPIYVRDGGGPDGLQRSRF
jgi:hypothetical protein